MKLTGKDRRAIEDNCLIRTGSPLHVLYVAIPHRHPPYLVDSDQHPPIESDGDNLFEGDHDLSMSVLLADALDHDGHQRHAVRAIAENLFAGLIAIVDDE